MFLNYFSFYLFYMLQSPHFKKWKLNLDCNDLYQSLKAYGDLICIQSEGKKYQTCINNVFVQNTKKNIFIDIAGF